MCLEAFLGAIDEDREPPQNLGDSLHITAIGWAANESLRALEIKRREEGARILKESEERG